MHRYSLFRTSFVWLACSLLVTSAASIPPPEKKIKKRVVKKNKTSQKEITWHRVGLLFFNFLFGRVAPVAFFATGCIHSALLEKATYSSNHNPDPSSGRIYKLTLACTLIYAGAFFLFSYWGMIYRFFKMELVQEDGRKVSKGQRFIYTFYELILPFLWVLLVGMIVNNCLYALPIGLLMSPIFRLIAISQGIPTMSERWAQTKLVKRK